MLLSRLLLPSFRRRSLVLDSPYLARFHSSSFNMSDKLPATPAVPGVPALGAVVGDASAATPTPTAPNAQADVPLDANGQPLTKSALKRLQKEKDLAAKKALKNANKPAAPAATGAGAAPKKEKVVKPKAEVPEEPAYIEVPEGHKKGEPALLTDLSGGRGR